MLHQPFLGAQKSEHLAAEFFILLKPQIKHKKIRSARAFSNVISRSSLFKKSSLGCSDSCYTHDRFGWGVGYFLKRSLQRNYTKVKHKPLIISAIPKSTNNVSVQYGHVNQGSHLPKVSSVHSPLNGTRNNLFCPLFFWYWQSHQCCMQTTEPRPVDAGRKTIRLLSR